MKTTHVKIALSLLAINTVWASPQWNLNVQNNSAHDIITYTPGPTPIDHCWQRPMALVPITLPAGKTSVITLSEDNGSPTNCSITNPNIQKERNYHFVIDTTDIELVALYGSTFNYKHLEKGHSSIVFTPGTTNSSSCEKDSNNSIVNLNIVYTESGELLLTTPTNKDWSC